MEPGTFRFEEFTLDPADRQLRRDGAPVELNGRYFDALALLVRESGRLVSKDRFMDEVWRGIPVTDEALTQCIRTLRRQLGDEASRPRFIETVPKHGYRFIAPVEAAGQQRTESRKPFDAASERARIGAAGTLGGAFAGLLGGLFYGFAVSGSAIGSASTVIVLVCVTLLVALLGAGAVAFGIALAGPRSPLAIVGGAAGGLVVGAVVKLIALDAFALLLGRAPRDVTGAIEGAALGGAVGLAAWLALTQVRAGGRYRAVAIGAGVTAMAAILIALLGGQMLGGSLAVLASTFPGSQLQLDQLGALFGENGFGRASQVITAALEGALFGGCVVGAMALAERERGPKLGVDQKHPPLAAER